MGKKVTIEIPESKLNELLSTSRRLRERAESAKVSVKSNSIELTGKVKLPGLNKNISILVEMTGIERDGRAVNFEIKHIKPSLFGLSKKILSLVPPNRYVEVHGGKFLKVNLPVVLKRVNYIENEDFKVENVKIENGKIVVEGEEGGSSGAVS